MHISSGRVYVSRDVVFDEQLFPFSEIQPSSDAPPLLDILGSPSLPSSSDFYGSGSVETGGQPLCQGRIIPIPQTVEQTDPAFAPLFSSVSGVQENTAPVAHDDDEHEAACTLTPPPMQANPLQPGGAPCTGAPCSESAATISPTPTRDSAQALEPADRRLSPALPGSSAMEAASPEHMAPSTGPHRRVTRRTEPPRRSSSIDGGGDGGRPRRAPRLAEANPEPMAAGEQGHNLRRLVCVPSRYIEGKVRYNPYQRHQASLATTEPVDLLKPLMIRTGTKLWMKSIKH